MRLSGLPRTGAGWTALPWLCGLFVGVVIVGPGLGGGQLLNLDLVTTPQLRAPDWRWGVGPGLPHRVPLYVPLAWLSSVVDGAVLIKLLYLVALAALFAGVWRFAASGDRRVDAGVALFVTASPFTTTRVSVGHINVVLAMAFVAWGAPALLQLDPLHGSSLRRLAGAGAFAGLMPGSWMLAVAAAGVIAAPPGERRLRVRQFLLLLPLQLWWLVPSALFAVTGPRLVGAAGFRPDIGLLAPLELVAGLGFWRTPSQVLGPPWWLVVSPVIILLALLGRPPTSSRFGRPWTLITATATLIPMLAVVPGLSTIISLGGAPLRESQRLWGMALVLLSPAFAAGAVELGRRLPAASAVAPMLPAVFAFLLAGNGLWGAQGSLVSVSYPTGWATVASILRTAPGTTLTLPWHQYLDVPFASGRRVLNPLPEYLPGDIVSSTDPELGAAQRQVDARAEPALAAVANPETAPAMLARLGIRYIAVALDPDDNNQLKQAPGITTIFRDRDITLFRVDATTTRPVDWLIGPVGHAKAGDQPVALPAGPGWMLGSHSLTNDGSSLVPVGRDGGWLWFWPSLLVGVGYLVAAAAWLTAIIRGRRDDGKPEQTLRSESAR